MPPSDPIPAALFDNSYARLPDRFHARLRPTPVAVPRLVRVNDSLARELALDPAALASQAGVEILAGNRIPSGADPIAMAYAGHQFGHFVPQLGDGRAILLGEIVDREGIRRDIQLKGSGPTPFSRRGDGRAALGPVLREYIVSEAMAALGIPTTRALAAVTTGETIWRDGELPGAVLTRIAKSHVRVGTFQFFAARRDEEAVRILADYVIARQYPEALESENRYLAFFHSVAARQADLVAQWLLVGFIHGVMNTDNMSMAGETIDYGPCAFMDSYHPDTVFSSIDEGGRYAYANQPRIAQWNLARLAETLLPLFAEEEKLAIALAQESLDTFARRFESAYAAGLCRKLGILDGHAEDLKLAQELLAGMAETGADFTLTFRALLDAADGKEEALQDAFADPAAKTGWLSRWRQRLARSRLAPDDIDHVLRAANPRFIPRNHRVEEVIVAAVEGDFAPFETLLSVLASPYDEQPEFAHYARPPRPEEVVERTFCGT
jgi:uncharacterized protein YdiU (UPF0061 family)